MTDYVEETLRLWRRMPFTWGGRVPHVPGCGDCLLSIGDYLASRGAPDVSARFRGTYDSEAGALALLEAYGGATGLVDLTGLPHIDTPSRGDVVVMHTGEAEIGALCLGTSIAARLERGVIDVNIRLVKIVQAWKVP